MDATKLAPQAEKPVRGAVSWMPNCSFEFTAMDLSTTPISPETSNRLYNIAISGNVSLIGFTDCHAQLQPIDYRMPGTHLYIDHHKQEVRPQSRKYFTNPYSQNTVSRSHHHAP